MQKGFKPKAWLEAGCGFTDTVLRCPEIQHIFLLGKCLCFEVGLNHNISVNSVSLKILTQTSPAAEISLQAPSLLSAPADHLGCQPTLK